MSLIILNANYGPNIANKRHSTHMHTHTKTQDPTICCKQETHLNWQNAAYCLDPHGFDRFSYTIQNHLTRDGTTPSGMGPSTFIINQENDLQTCLHAIQWRHFLIDVLLPR